MLKVGITGGIGSGKSMVARIFGVLGIPVYNADDAAKRLMDSDTVLRQALMAEFGTELYADGQLNRPYLANLVFNNQEKLSRLNAIVHPTTIQDAADWMQRQTAPYVLKEAALIFESGSQQGLDYVIGVSAPEALRLQRTMQRDTATREQIKARMSKQIDETIKMRLCDFVIVNDEQQMVIPQVLALHEQLLDLAKTTV
jgi:dephospho-CoA kinase